MQSSLNNQYSHIVITRSISGAIIYESIVKLISSPPSNHNTCAIWQMSTRPSLLSINDNDNLPIQETIDR